MCAARSGDHPLWLRRGTDLLPQTLPLLEVTMSMHSYLCIRDNTACAEEHPSPCQVNLHNSTQYQATGLAVTASGITTRP
jgi:hypothetical protein